MTRGARRSAPRTKIRRSARPPDGARKGSCTRAQCGAGPQPIQPIAPSFARTCDQRHSLTVGSGQTERGAAADRHGGGPRRGDRHGRAGNAETGHVCAQPIGRGGHRVPRPAGRRRTGPAVEVRSGRRGTPAFNWPARVAVLRAAELATDAHGPHEFLQNAVRVASSLRWPISGRAPADAATRET